MSYWLSFLIALLTIPFVLMSGIVMMGLFQNGFAYWQWSNLFWIAGSLLGIFVSARLWIHAVWAMGR